MKRLYAILSLLFVLTTTILAQGTVKGKVLDKQNDEALGFVNVVVTPRGGTEIKGSAVTDMEGNFIINDLKNGQYTLKLTFVGYKTVQKQFAITASNRSQSYPALYMTEDATMLNEVKVTGQRSTMKLEVDRKSFDVQSNLSNAGESASEVLDNIPSVEVDNDGNVSLRGNSSVEVWINGRSAGLTSDNMGQVLQQIPAESIERIEVIDNPSAKFSAEGSAGIINIVLKKDRKAGYYGSLQAGVDTRAGANAGFNFNYNSKVVDFFVNIGYRHRENEGKSSSDQTNLDAAGNAIGYSRYDTKSTQMGNNLFSRAGLTFHLAKKDDIALTGMLMHGKHKSWANTPYYYGSISDGIETPTRIMMRNTKNSGPMDMLNGEFNYRHNFSETHFLDFVVSGDRWNSDMQDIYRDSTTYLTIDEPTEYAYQSRPMNIHNRSYEVKLDYENKISDVFKLQTGYNGRFSKENTPNQSFESSTWEGEDAQPNKSYFNRFIYQNDVHAGYVTTNFTLGKFGIMAGLRGEYWTVNTVSRNWDQEYNGQAEDKYKKTFFQLFPSVFMSYQLPKEQQLQLNYTRRLRRPWGGELNSFRNTSDASMISFGNPMLTPEYSNSFSLNYLKTWAEHSILVSAYYRPTSDVIQRINYKSEANGMMYSTSMNVAKSVSSGLEITAKDKLFRILDLSTNVNAYYYKLDGFSDVISIDEEGNPVTSGGVSSQTVTGESNSNFTWNARITASFKLPYDISIQAGGRYNSRQVITQGHRPASYQMDLGIKKNFFNRLFTLSINCRDVFDSRKRESYTSGDGYTRYQMNKWGGRKVKFTLTWNFGNNKPKRDKRDEDKHDQQEGEDDNNSGSGYDM